ncbi:MAG TPA: thioredoxin domain-containing protein [Geobacteraceae bacterium]
MEKNTEEDGNMRLQRLIEVDKNSLPADGGPAYNRLIFAGSPYLLQHAENPVDWYQWEDEAFARAKREDKPIFLSIGYATCHWCHVMERESFEDRQVAEILNAHFVSVKVDREERPDIDDQFMAVAQMALEGGAGWPLTVILNPDGKPFYVATYIPREPRRGMPGIIDILEKIAELWRTARDTVEGTCNSFIKELAAKAEPTAAAIPERSINEDVFRYLERIYDPQWGGFGAAPKFPRPLFLSFLLAHEKKGKSAQALAMAERTLKMMRYGGIFDQLGFGFHRYSVDRQWLAPHFEKMLYDQGMLAIAYLEAFQITGNALYREVAEEIFTHVREEMTSSEGGFYSARDADTEGEEGKYYLWTPAEVEAVLGSEEGRRVCALFDISEKGNFEGKNIPRLSSLTGTSGEGSGLPAETLPPDVARWRDRLLGAREARIKPLRDEKILTAWNGLMIAALAKGYAVTGELRHLEAAANAARFVRKRLVAANGRLLRCHFAGESAVPAFLEDFAFLIWGLIEMYEATLEEEYLREAAAFSKAVLRLFGDEFSYGLYDTGKDAENILVRRKSTVDGVISSGNSLAAMNFIRLGRIMGKKGFVKEGEGILRSMMGDLLTQPVAHIQGVLALDLLRGPDVDITLVGKREDPEAEGMLRLIGGRYIPGLTLRFRGGGGEAGGYRTLDGKATAYVCSGGLCRPPVAGREALKAILDEVAP